MVNQPDVVELTKEEYENGLSIELGRGDSKKVKAPVTRMEQNQVEQTGSSFQGTRAEAIKILCERGLEYAVLKNKKKQELIDLLWTKKM